MQILGFPEETLRSDEITTGTVYETTSQENIIVLMSWTVINFEDKEVS